MAARLRREFSRDVTMIHGSYGEFKVLVDDEVVIDAGALTALGIVPSNRRIIAAVRARLTIP
ncbi:MAG TPA: hypothetical protein VJ802_07615 [Gemmatimonadaceae bacterium]|nr:hypothetical protein [Gemmatimonadaceae bacterium]